MPRQKEMTQFLAFDWWATDLADKPTPYATLAKKSAYKKREKPETKVTALAKLSAPLMLRHGIGSCLEAAQHSLGSQHSPPGSGWNATPRAISHLIHKRNEQAPEQHCPDALCSWQHILIPYTPQCQHTASLQGASLDKLQPVWAALWMQWVTLPQGLSNCRGWGWAFQVLHLSVRWAGTACVCLWSNFSHFS